VSIIGENVYAENVVGVRFVNTGDKKLGVENVKVDLCVNIIN